MYYQIITKTCGTVVRKRATKPYKACWITRDKNGNVIPNIASDCTTTPAKKYLNNPDYVQVVAIRKGEPNVYYKY
jgi:hypothetical protein